MSSSSLQIYKKVVARCLWIFTGGALGGLLQLNAQHLFDLSKDPREMYDEIDSLGFTAVQAALEARFTQFQDELITEDNTGNPANQQRLFGEAGGIVPADFFNPPAPRVDALEIPWEGAPNIVFILFDDVGWNVKKSSLCQESSIACNHPTTHTNVLIGVQFMFHRT